MLAQSKVLIAVIVGVETELLEENSGCSGVLKENRVSIY